MKRSSKFNTLIITAGLSLLTIPAFAQGSGSSGSSSGAGSNADRPGSSTSGSGSGSAYGSGSSNSGSSISGSGSDSSTSGMSSSQGAEQQAAAHFKMIDTDLDGRVSETEFTSQASTPVSG